MERSLDPFGRDDRPSRSTGTDGAGRRSVRCVASVLRSGFGGDASVLRPVFFMFHPDPISDVLGMMCHVFSMGKDVFFFSHFSSPVGK